MTRRTEIQLALLVIGVIVWGYGQRIEDTRLTYIGLAFFVAATALRFLKRRDDYWNKKAYPFKTVKIRVITDPTASANSCCDTRATR